MKLKLKAPRDFFPQGLDFTDARTGAKFSAYQLSIAGAVQAVIQHRSANPTIYATAELQHFDEVLVRQEYYRQVFEKQPGLFSVVNGAPLVVVSAAPGSCYNCGSLELVSHHCPTCSGARVTSVTCNSCGARQP